MTQIEALRIHLQHMERGQGRFRGSLPFGIATIDRRLPEGGLRLGALHEVAGGSNGALHGAAAALFTAGILARTPGKILWCMRQNDLFAPGLAQAGLTPDRVIYVDAGDEKTLLACMEEGLRHGGVSGVVGEVGKLSMVASRRLQLAAESTGAIAIAIRRWWKMSDAADFGQPTAARTRWRVTAAPSALLPVQGIGRARWHIELVHCRAGSSADFTVEACDEEGYLALPADLGYRQGATAQERRAAY